MREGVVVAQHDDVRVVEQVVRAEAAAGVEPARRDRELDVGPLVRVVGDGLAQLEVEADAGEVGREPAHDVGQPGGPHRREVGEGERAGPSRAEVGDHGLGLAEAREHAVGLGGEREPGRGGPHAAARAFEERQAGLALQRGDVLAHGGRRVPERGRGGLDRPARDDGAEDPQTVDVQHPTTLQRD